jgi:2-polyprenyl-6-methoxyphenol hydroxylase-like FAD-dependent oxidoreductase
MTTYDAIVVGARCAGSPTAMLLARQGYRVLLVDRATFPSDTVSTHVIHAPGVAALRRWGLRDELAATGCPPVDRYSFDFGFFRIEGSPRPAASGEATAYCPRRYIIDKVLVDAAVTAGVEVREGFTVDEVVVEDGAVVGIRSGSTVERARVVVGADGRNSLVARAVQPEQYNEKPAVGDAAYTYFRGVESGGFDAYILENCGFAAFPTHDALTLVIAGTKPELFSEWRTDLEGHFLKALDQSPIGAQVRAAERTERFHVATDLAGYFRKPFGPGWALVGDAGYHKHPITAMGMTDAFLDAERLVTALDDCFAGRATYEEAMARYQAERDGHAMPMYEMTFEFASMDPPPPEQQALLAAVAGNQDAMDQFVSVQAGTMPIPEFFAPDNVGRIMAAAAS